MQEAGVERLFVGLLLGIVADQRDFFLRRFHGAGSLGSDFEFAIGCGDRAYYRLSAFDRDVKFGAGLDVLDGVEFERDLTGGVGVQDQRLAIGLDDSPGQAVAVLQGDLVGE